MSGLDAALSLLAASCGGGAAAAASAADSRDAADDDEVEETEYIFVSLEGSSNPKTPITGDVELEVRAPSPCTRCIRSDVSSGRPARSRAPSPGLCDCSPFPASPET